MFWIGWLLIGGFSVLATYLFQINNNIEGPPAVMSYSQLLWTLIFIPFWPGLWISVLSLAIGEKMVDI